MSSHWAEPGHAERHGRRIGGARQDNSHEWHTELDARDWLVGERGGETMSAVWHGDVQHAGKKTDGELMATQDGRKLWFSRGPRRRSWYWVVTLSRTPSLTACPAVDSRLVTVCRRRCRYNYADTHTRTHTHVLGWLSTSRRSDSKQPTWATRRLSSGFLWIKRPIRRPHPWFSSSLPQSYKVGTGG